MPKRGSVRLLLLFFHPSARLGWRIGAAVALVALAFMAEGSGSVQPGARSALSQLTDQSAWRHALKDEPAQKIWPWEDTLARQRNAVPRLGLSAAVLREASGGANIAPAAPRQGPGAPAEPSRAQLGDVAIGDGIPVPTPDNLFRDYRVGGRTVVDPHLAQSDSGAPADGEVAPIFCWPFDVMANSLRAVIQATRAEQPKVPEPSVQQKL